MTTIKEIEALAAPLITILLGVIVLLLDLGKARGTRDRLLPLVSIVGLIFAGIISLSGAQSESGYPVFGGGMISDARGGLFSFVLCLVAALAIGMAPAYLQEKGINQGEFYSLVLFSASGAMIMASANDLVNVFVGLEVLSVALYILSGFARRERRSEESAVKYFLLGAFASGFLLYGTALIYGSVGLAAQSGSLLSAPDGSISYTGFSMISEALGRNLGLATSPIFIAGVGLVIVGLGFKAAIVPFHSYAPDVYEGAPTPVTAFMSVAAKAGAFAALLRLFEAILGPGTAMAQAESPAAFAPYHAVLWGLAAATMVVGNVLAVRQTSIKRMLAYSSIAHAGYILVGVLASASPSASVLAQDAVRFYLLAYTFMNIGAFAVIVWLGRNGGEYLDIRDYAGLARRNPLAAAVLSVFLLSLSGIPLTAGFLGKLYLFLSAIKAGEASLAVIGLVVSAIGVFYYLNLIVQMYFRSPEHDFDAPRGGGAQAVAIIAALATIVFGVLPIPVLGPSGIKAASSGIPAPTIAPGASDRATVVPGDLTVPPNPGAGTAADAPVAPQAAPVASESPSPTPEATASVEPTPSAEAPLPLKQEPVRPITAPSAAATPIAAPISTPMPAIPTKP